MPTESSSNVTDTGNPNDIVNDADVQPDESQPTVLASAKGHVCTDPDAHGPQGGGHGYGHGGEQVDPPSDTPIYGGKVEKKKIASQINVEMGWMPEDNDNSKHTDGDYTPAPGATPPSSLGVPISVWLTPGAGKEYNDGYITRLSFDISEKSGTFYTGTGQALEDGESFTDDYGNTYTIDISARGIFSIAITPSSGGWKPVDLAGLGGLYFRPEGDYSDADFPLEYYVQLANEKKGSSSEASSSFVAIDAVADQPDYWGGADEEVVIGVSNDSSLSATETSYDEGTASQTIGGGVGASGSLAGISLGDFEFYDYQDGSEEHSVLLHSEDTANWTLDIDALGQGEYAAFVRPEGGVLETIWLDANNMPVAAGTPGATEYYKFVLNNEYLAEHDGLVSLDLPVIMGSGTKNGTYNFDIKVAARETVEEGDPDNTEIDFGNNFAVTDGQSVQVKVQTIASVITVSTGWAYESAAIAGGPGNPGADPAGTGVGEGQTTFPYIGPNGQVLGSSALINLVPELAPGESLGAYITLSYDASRGNIYGTDGEVLNSVSGNLAYVTLPSSWLNSGKMPLHFVPNPNSDDHSDIAITYEFTVKVPGADGEIKEFAIHNEIPIVIDAVADPAHMDLAPSGDAPEFDGFVLDYEATIRPDNAETQYLIISDPSGLLQLGDPGSYLTQVSLEELRSFENPDPNVGHHFDDIGANDVILRIDDLRALDALDGVADGTINLKIPFTVTDREAAGTQVNVGVKTVVVDSGGNQPENWQSEDREYDFANNIIVREDAAVVHLAQGEITAATAGVVYEGDRDQQHRYGDADAPEYGTTIDLSFADASEAIHELGFTLSTADNSPVDGVMAFGVGSDYTVIPQGGKLLFSSVLVNNQARYTGVQVVDANGAVIADYVISPASALQALNAAGGVSGLRFIPSGDNDADMRVDMSARVTDVRSGDVITMENIASVTIVRDAVADKPTELAADIAAPEGGYAAVVAGSTITVTVSATVGDYADGSEAHYLFISKDYLASVAIPTELADSFTLLDADAAHAVCDQVDGPGGLPGASADTHFIIRVEPGYAQAHDGRLDLPLSATLRTDIGADGSADIDVKAVAVEHQGFLTATDEFLGNGDMEHDAANNVAVSDTSTAIAWATLENKFSFTVTDHAYENDQPAQHTGNAAQAGGAGITISPQDASEVFDTLTVSYLGEDGSAASGRLALSVGSASLDIPSGTTLTLAYDAANPTLCVGVSYTDGEGNIHSLAVPGLTLDQLTSQGLHYIPDPSGNDSDTDVLVTFSGTTRETASGESGVFEAVTVHVIVDAVADKPDGGITEYDYAQHGQDEYGNPYTSIPEGSDVSFQINTTFRDITDGSETQYLFINTKYFVDGAFALIDTASGQPFTGGTLMDDPAALAALYAQINGNPGLVPGPDDAYVALKLDPAYLAGTGGVVSLTVNGALLDAVGLLPYGPEKTTLDFDVKAVAVEHQGYGTAGVVAETNDEYTPANNVAVTDVGVHFTWDALSGKFTVAPQAAFEGDQPGQHLGDPALAGGAALVITPEDSTEVFTRMNLDYDATHGDMVLSADGASITLHPGADVTFVFDAAEPARIISVSCGEQTLAVPGLTLEQLTSLGLRYVPHDGDNDDADVAVTITADTLETTIGTTGTTRLDTVIVVDAVADMPQDASSELHVTHGKNDTVIFNETDGPDSFDLTLNATFSDYGDGSERHYIFVASDYLASLEGLPENITLLDDMAAAGVLSNAGLGGKYMVLEVGDAYLQASNGAVNITLTAHLDGASLPAEGETLHIDIKAGAIEHQGLNTPVNGSDLGGGHGQDTGAANNVSLADMGLDLNYARLDNDFAVTVVNAYEDDAPNQHVGNHSPAGGTIIDFAPSDVSEVFDALTVDYNDAEGSLYLDLPVLGQGNVRVALSDGAHLDFAYRNEGAGATLCTTVTVTIDGTAASYTLATHMPLHDLMGGGRLHYIPDTDSQSDDDVNVVFSGISRETASGESGEFSHTVLVKVDAVADKPDATGHAANADAARSALEPGVAFPITVNADFGDDTGDGSEAHYLFVGKTYLASLSIPDSQEGVVLLSDDEAATACAQVDGKGGIPGASADAYYVLKVDAAWLQAHDGAVDLLLQGALKDAAALQRLGQTEGTNLTLDIKAVAVEHQGFQTSTAGELDAGHGYDIVSDNNVAVDDASSVISYAVADGTMVVSATSAYEGDQPRQHYGDLSAAGGASITLAPQDASEVFTDLTLNYGNAHGLLTLSGTDGTSVALHDGAKLVFHYDPAHPAECVSVEIWQSATDTAPAATLSFLDAFGRGLGLTDLTTEHLRYTPAHGDHDDADVPVSYAGTVLETQSGALAAVQGSVTVVVDAVADLPVNTQGDGFVTDTATGNHVAAQPGDTFTLTLNANFSDYEDGSEAHYILIAKEHLLDLGGFSEDVALVTDAAELTDLFKALAQTGGTGIHAGSGAASKYYVLRVDPGHLSPDGRLDLNLTTTAGDKGSYAIEAKAVSVEHDGYQTKVDGIGGGADRDVAAANNVAVADMGFNLLVREFEPGKVVVTLDDWAFENDRSHADDTYHAPGDNQDRDHGVRLHIQEPGEGNVVSSITFEYSMPSNGSAVPHRIESSAQDVTVTQTIADGRVTVTVTANDPYGSVGELRFVPGDNYDNADVNINVVEVHVSDPLLHTTTRDDPDWGNGVAPGFENLHVKVDAVAEAPGISDMAMSHGADDLALRGGILHITGKVSFEDTADGSEQHFVLLEMQDGYYPDSVTLTFNGQSVTIPVTHYTPDTPANYTMQQLLTADDNQPHLFIKLPVDEYLHTLMNGGVAERMDGIQLDVAYQTREWAVEGTALHFAAIATEDVEQVREYDADWNVVNDELPFDKQLEEHVPGLTVVDNNTAITIAAGAAHVFWDETDSGAVNFDGYVYENDRPSDHVRNPVHSLSGGSAQNYPVNPELQPADPFTGRDYGTGVELKIPANVSQLSLTESAFNQGQGDFYFLPQSVWEIYTTSPAPHNNNAIAQYKVPVNGDVVKPTDQGPYTLVFIPAHEPYDQEHEVHKENDAHGSHSDADYHFSYEIVTNQYSPSGALVGQKRYLGEDKVIRVDAVANQADILSAATGGEDPFSLWATAGTATTTKFDLSVAFHDVDGTEDHYVLVEMVPNFAFRCGGYYYRPGAAGSVASENSDAIYTHTYVDANGQQCSIRYYKVPVSLEDIDPVSGQATLAVEFIREPGMPLTADYPSSDKLSYGALTEDLTSARWDSTDPTSPNFINRKDADGEYTYENNTSVIIHDGIGNGADDADRSPGWWDGTTGGSGGGGGSGNGYIHWENGPGQGWSNGYLPFGSGTGGGSGGGTGDGGSGNYWNPDGPAGSGDWWINQGSGTGGGDGGQLQGWIPDDGGDWNKLPGGGGGTGGGTGGDWTENKWIASHSNGIAVEWVFENSTPLGHSGGGRYNEGVLPTEIFLTGENSNADAVKFIIPESNGGLIFDADEFHSSWWYWRDVEPHSRATLAIGPDPEHLVSIPSVRSADGWEFTVSTLNGELPPGQHLFLIVSPESMGEDFQMGVQWYNGDTLTSSGQVDVLVDSAAQWANFKLENESGVYGVTGENPSHLIDINVETYFLDQDGSESNYVLVEKIPGVLPLHANAEGGYDAVREVYLEGKTYYIIEPTKEEQRLNQVTLQFSVNEDLTSPLHVRNDIVHDNMTFSGMSLNIGTLTVEGQTGWGAAGDTAANWEYTLDNNTALNIQEDALTIVLSKVNATAGNSSIMALETGAPEDNLIWLDPADPDKGLNLTMDGNDILTSLVFTGIAGNGSFWYVDDDGVHHPLPTGVNMLDAYLAGRIYHKQDRYQDADASLEWTAGLRDGLSPDSDVSVGGTLTVVVDAVARADEIRLGFPLLDKDADTLTQTLTFDDHQGNEQHYAVIAPDLYRVVGREAQVRDADGVWHSVGVETIFSPNGDPYYAVLLDGYLDADGSATVRFDLHELNIPGIENYPVISGGVSIEPNAGFYPEDREPNLTNNWAINTEVKLVHEGTVSSKDLAFTAVAVTEDDPAGAPLSLSGSVGGNDVILSASLLFTSPALADMGAAGEQIATIVYAGRCFAVVLDDTGHAVADVPFGEEGFDPSADFRIIWGVARMDNGALVVDAWNHHADAALQLTTTFSVRNLLSDHVGTVTGADPDGVDVIAWADAAQNVSGQTTAVNHQPAVPDQPVGAGADSVTVTLGGEFADLDGSESHYLLLEIPDGWQVLTPADGAYVVEKGVRYYRVEVDGAQASPTADVTLRAPDGLNGETTLKTAAYVVDSNGHAQFSQGGDLALHVSDVSASGLDASVSPILEDTPLSLDALAEAALLKADANDTLLSVTFTDLKGGILVDADGNPLSGLTFSRDELASGQVLYRPAAQYAGELDDQGRPLPLVLGYDALLGETDTGATAAVSGQTLSVTVIPVADAPDHVGGVSHNATLDEVQTGHKALVSVTLQAAFADVDGSEQHFFVVTAPAGVAVLEGAGYTLTSLNAEELAALSGFDPAFAASGTLYKIALDDGTAAAVSLAVNLEVTTTMYNGGQLAVWGGSSELLADGARDYGFTAAPSVTLPPAIEHGIGNLDPVPLAGAAAMDSLRQTDVSGALAMDVDPDGDAVEVNSVTGSQPGVWGVDDQGQPSFVVQGLYGTLYLHEDGAYHYVLRADAQGASDDDVFAYTVQDGYGGTGQSTITISLSTPNTAPSAPAVEAQLDSVRQTQVSDALLFADGEGDAVAVASVGGTSALTNFGTDDSPLWGFEVAGQYGTLRVYEDADGRWRYVYALDPEHRGEERDESFTFTVRDEYGMESESSITVDLYNNNAAPVAEAGAATLDTLRDADGVTDGSVALRDADGDPVGLRAATGPDGAAGAWGQDDQGENAFVVQGRYGTLYLYQNDQALHYRYVLTHTAEGGLDATESFTYTVDDGFLGTASSSITIDLSNANAAPEISGDLSRELDTLRSVTGQSGGTLVFSDPDYNPDQGRHDLVTLGGVSFNGASGAADGQGGFTVNGAYGVFHIDALGAYTYELHPEFAGTVGVEAFTVALEDEFGAVHSQTVSIDLVARNQNPTASSGQVAMNTWRDGEASGLVTLRDADGDAVLVDGVSGVDAGIWGADPDGKPAFVVRGEYGTLYLHTDGSYDYVLDDAAQGASGTDSFAFSVRDDFGGTASNTIAINLSDANAAPVISGDLNGAIEGSVQDYEHGIIHESGSIAWSDADGDAIGSVTVGGVALPGSGEVSVEGRYGTLLVTTGGASAASWVYTMKPGLDMQGIDDVDSFDVVVRDIYGAESSQALDISLTPLSHAPECEDLNVTWPKTPSGLPVSFIVGDLPFSDADMGYNPDESLHLTVNNTVIADQVTVQGRYGTLTINPDGGFTYTTTAIDEDLLEDFVYTVTDSTGKSDEAHLYIRLSDNAPVFPNQQPAPAALLGEEQPVAPDNGPHYGDHDGPDNGEDGTAPDSSPDPSHDSSYDDSIPDPVEPVDVGLVNVPLPYDPVENGLGLSA